MADAGGNRAGRPDPGRPPVFIPSYDAPTTPMPRIRPTDPPPKPVAKPVPVPPVSTEPPASPGPDGQPVADSDSTVQVRRRDSSGAFPDQRPLPGRAPKAQPPPSAATPPETPKRMNGVVLRMGDIPLRAVYTVGALIVTVIAVVLVFMLFSEDKPAQPVRATPDKATPGAAPAVRPTPTPAIKLPDVPASKFFPVLPGTASVISSYVVDRNAGISYAKLGSPWGPGSAAPFTTGQKVGSARLPRTLIVSGPLPGAVPKNLTTYPQYRNLALKAAKWSLRYHPAATKLTWTASQPLRSGFGWLLAYKVSYLVDGKKHSSQAIVALVSTGKKKPALLFATVADSRDTLYRDLNSLFWTVRRVY